MPSWRVSLTTGGQNPQTIEKSLDAPDQGVAIMRASAGMPGVQFTQASATALDPVSKSPTQQPAPNAQNALGQIPQRPGITPPRKVGEAATRRPPINTKAFAYPYAITLPAGFAPIMEQSSPVRVLERYGQYHMVLPTENHMKAFLKNLRGQRDKKSAAVIMNGLRSTIRE